ncbi:hypothetical protein C2G38_2183813 [Gigaspora rosea]|uniref:Uncharacterized protein n=1 Tax=Gigaspora rosea TaxID=44941 RepID=A0A397VAL3_9GLOM|nr:hypothetical protein C2G38_2183813 [Gigaspora rosea]
MFMDSSGSYNACIDTFSDLGITTTSRMIQWRKSIISEEHNDTELIKTNIESRFMRLYGLSHNCHWGFHMVDDDTRLEELTVHSYDIRLKEKRSSRSMKDTIFINLQKNDLHTMDAYIKAINAV